MKKIIAGLLSICLVAGLFTGSSVFAENTDDGSMVVMPGEVPVLGKSYTHVYQPWANPESEYDVTFTQTADFAGIGFKGGIVMDCEVPTGQQPCVRFYDLYLKPNTTVKADNNIFMMYTQMPEYVASALPDGRRWNELMRFLSVTVKQDDKEYSSDMTNLKIRYLSEDAAIWKETALNGTVLTSELSGFCGYMMFDLSSVPSYGSWAETGFDAAADYTVTQIKVQNSVVGGACGPFKVGGFYGIDTYKADAITAQIKNVPVTKALSEYDPNPIKVTSTNMPSFNGGSGTDKHGRLQPWSTGYGDNPYSDDGDGGENMTALMKVGSGGAGTNSHHIAFTAETPHGYLSQGNSYKYRVNVKTQSASQGAVGAMFYIELPETGLGYSSMRIDAINQDGEWPSVKGKKDGYAYLEKSGKEWISGDVASNGELKLPDGFKGYVKLYIDGVTKDGWYMIFSWGLFGGDYGDVILGGSWSIVEDHNSRYVKFAPSMEALETTDAVKVADGSELEPIRGTMKDPMYDGLWGNVVGGTAGRVKIDNKSIEAGVTATFSENSESLGTQMMSRISSENTAEYVRVDCTCWNEVDPVTNTVMIWMEVPKAASGSAITIRVEGPNAQQNKKWYFANPRGLQYAYLAADSNRWVNDVIADDSTYFLKLPDGFKGYVKFDLSTLNKYRSDWAANGFQYDQSYTLNDMTFIVSALGGEHGDFVLGTWTALTYDSNSLSAIISNSDTAVDGAPEALTRYAESGVVKLEELRKILEEIGELDVTDYSLIEQAIEIYEGLSQEYKDKLTEEEKADYEAKVTGYNVYRPSFRGVAAYVPNGGNMAGFRLGSVANVGKAAEEGYTVKSYGTVMMPKSSFNALNQRFDVTTTGAVDYTFENTNGQTALNWDVDYTSRNWKEYKDDFYFRSYVTYSNGTRNIAVWNATVTNRASMSIGEYKASAEELKTLGNGFVKQVEFEAPYYVTSIVQTANLFGISVLSGHEYGNLNGDYILEGTKAVSNIDGTDVSLMKDYLIEKDSPKVWYMSDLDGDSEISVKDLVRFKKYLNDRDNVTVGQKRNRELLDYDKPKDVYGETSVSIIGDSISQGLNAGNLYDDSWASIFKNAFNQHFGANNIGFVSFNDGYADKAGETDAATYKEIHKLTMGADDQWNITKFWTGTPGLYLYTAANVDTDSVLNIALNRRQGGIDRHINGFYIYHTTGPDYGNFEILVNDVKVASVDCAADERDMCARSEFIRIPEGMGDEITIKIVKSKAVTGTVQIAGISYREDTTSPVVNNYSLSGCRLVDFSDEMLSKIATANVVMLTLGTNDLGTDCDLEVFKEKLKIVVDTCKRNGSKLVIGDVIWNLANRPKGAAFKLALKNAAVEMGEDGYYIDFNEIPVDKLLDVKTDSYHPTKQGHKLMGMKLINFFGLN